MFSFRFFSRKNNEGTANVMNGEELANRYQCKKKLANTLQGEIYVAKDLQTNELVIVKTALKHCVDNGVSKDNHKIPEDFHNECRVQRQITNGYLRHLQRQKLHKQQLQQKSSNNNNNNNNNTTTGLTYNTDGEDQGEGEDNYNSDGNALTDNDNNNDSDGNALTDNNEEIKENDNNVIKDNENENKNDDIDNNNNNNNNENEDDKKKKKKRKKKKRKKNKKKQYQNNDKEVNLVTLLDCFQDNNNYYLVMEHCKDGDLFHHIANYHRSKSILRASVAKWIERVQGIFRQLVLGVYFLHRHNIVHRDLSLENTMVFDIDSWYVKIIDFGVAKEMGPELTTIKGRVGKTNYMSPECYRNMGYNPYANDIWCLGIMLFMMLVGSPPPVRDDRLLPVIIGGQIKHLLQQCKRAHMVSEQALDCLNRILTLERRRISLLELLGHPFVGIDLTELYPNDPLLHPSLAVLTAVQDPTPINLQQLITERINQVEKLLKDWDEADKGSTLINELQNWLMNTETKVHELIAEKSQLCRPRTSEDSETYAYSRIGSERYNESDHKQEPSTSFNQLQEEQKLCGLIDNCIVRLKYVSEEMRLLLNRHTFTSYSSDTRKDKKTLAQDQEIDNVSFGKNISKASNAENQKLSSFEETANP